MSHGAGSNSRTHLLRSAMTRIERSAGHRYLKWHACSLMYFFSDQETTACWTKHLVQAPGRSYYTQSQDSHIPDVTIGWLVNCRAAAAAEQARQEQVIDQYNAAKQAQGDEREAKRAANRDVADK